LTIRDYQEEQLFILIRAAKDTPFGQKHRFNQLQRYEDFANEVSLCFYKDIKADIEQLKEGKNNPYWPGTVNRFAVSAGTSGEGKHLPLTSNRLESDQRFMHKVTADYLRQRPNIFNLWGKHISLPGNMECQNKYQIGEISAFTAQQTPWWLSYFQLIEPEKLVQLPFGEKVNQIVQQSIKRDIRVISAAPSWILTVFQGVLERTKSESIRDIWPKLRLLVCGGVKLANYRTQLQQLIGDTDIDFIETYGASEGYFAYSDRLDRQDMKLVIDNGLFYEFVPNPLPDQDSLAIQEAIPLWEVETGTPYALIVSSNAGLWRYAMNDIIRFTKTDPPRIKIMGRVSEMLDDFGEALYAYEAEEALQEAARRLNLDIGTFTVGALLSDKHSLPCHYWFVRSPALIHRNTLDRLAQTVDEILQTKNRHYAIRRESQALGMPKMNSITQQDVNRWLQKQDKQKAQGKLPAILNNQRDVNFFL